MATLRQQQLRGAVLELGIGLPINVALGAALYWSWLPAYAAMDSAQSRIAFAMQCSALPAATVLLGICAVALTRATSPAIDPLADYRSRVLTIHQRFLIGNVEQVLLFFVSALALSPTLDADTIRIVPTAAVLFAVNRVVFWLAYLRDPMLRAVGLPGSFYVVTAMAAYAAYRAGIAIFGG